MNEKMFCFQCQETAGCTGCKISGVCGKTPQVAHAQDLLIYVLKGLGVIFGLICDNRFYLKPTEAGRSLLRSVEMRPPYDGAKDYFFIEDVDDRDYITELVRVTCKELPLAKPKRK